MKLNSTLGALVLLISLNDSIAEEYTTYNGAYSVNPESLSFTYTNNSNTNIYRGSDDRIVFGDSTLKYYPTCYPYWAGYCDPASYLDNGSGSMSQFIWYRTQAANENSNSAYAEAMNDSRKGFVEKMNFIVKNNGSWNGSPMFPKKIKAMYSPRALGSEVQAQTTECITREDTAGGVITVSYESSAGTGDVNYSKIGVEGEVHYDWLREEQNCETWTETLMCDGSDLYGYGGTTNSLLGTTMKEVDMFFASTDFVVDHAQGSTITSDKYRKRNDTQKNYLRDECVNLLGGTFNTRKAGARYRRGLCTLPNSEVSLQGIISLIPFSEPVYVCRYEDRGATTVYVTP